MRRQKELELIAKIIDNFQLLNFWLFQYLHTSEMTAHTKMDLILKNSLNCSTFDGRMVFNVHMRPSLVSSMCRKSYLIFKKRLFLEIMIFSGQKFSQNRKVLLDSGL